MDIELSLHDYWRILRKRRWVILTVFSSTLLSTVFYTNLQTPVYRAQLTVKYEPPGAGPRMLGGDLGSLDMWSAVQTQLKLIASRDMVDRIAGRLGIAPEKVRGSYDAERVESTNLILISATSDNPAASADLASAVAAAYIERDEEERSRQARRTLEDIGSRRGEVEASLHSLEDRKKEFLQEHQGISGSAALSGTLADLEAQRREMLKKFTTAHPEAVRLEQRIASVRARLGQAPGLEQEFDRLVRDIKVNEEVFVGLSRQLEEAKIAVASVVPYASVVSKAAVPKRPVYPKKKLNAVMGGVLGLFLGLLLAFLLENLDISINTIEEIEKILGVPVLGIIPHFGAGKRWSALRSHLLRKQRYPLDVFRSMLVFHHRAKSPVIEVYHSLRANIQSQLPKAGPMVFTFTSTGVAEGKTLTAVNFALAGAHAGLKTLLVGADIRRPVMHRIFGLPKQPGLVEVLTGSMSWEEVLQGTVDFLMGEIDLDRLLSFSGIDNFKVMTGWASGSTDIVNLLSSPAVPRLVEELRPRFDLIVFDCPPVLLFVDPLLIGPHTDGVVMVYKAGKMARRALKRAKDQVVSAKANILGVVLNDMHATDMEPRYGYYYDYGHYARKEEQGS